MEQMHFVRRRQVNIENAQRLPTVKIKKFFFTVYLLKYYGIWLWLFNDVFFLG